MKSRSLAGKLALVLVLAMVLSLAAATGLAGCKPATTDDESDDEATEPGAGPGGPWVAGGFVDGQYLKYDVLVTVDGRTGTGWVSFNVTTADVGVLDVAYAGKGPGIAGSPIYDGHEFLSSVTVRDTTYWREALTNALDGSSAPMTKPLLQAWNDIFTGQTSWDAGTSWKTADGATVSLAEKKTFAGIEGMAGQVTEVSGQSISFCVAEEVPLPLYAKVVDNGVVLEYSLVEANGF